MGDPRIDSTKYSEFLIYDEDFLVSYEYAQWVPCQALATDYRSQWQTNFVNLGESRHMW